MTLSIISKEVHAFLLGELKQRAAKKLLTHVINGEQDKAHTMIKKNPSFLLLSGKAFDYSGRLIVGTAFQAAIGAGDKPMWEMMLPYFEDLEQGEALRQFNEQFPNGIEDEVSAIQLKDCYNALVSAIINDKEDDRVVSAIEKFRTNITNQKEITRGKHFNLQHLIAAYQAYTDHVEAFQNKNRDLFFQQVIGYVQRQMTAYDAQVHCFGVQSVLDNKNNFERKLNLFCGGSFFPLSADSGLGFDAWLASDETGASLDRCTISLWFDGGRAKFMASLEAFGKYVQQKQIHLQALEALLLIKECSISSKIEQDECNVYFQRTL